MPQSAFSSTSGWVILSEIEARIKAKIEKAGTPLKDWDVQINYGIKTGFNEAFIIDQKKRDELVEKCPKAAEIIRPILLGRNIKRYQFEWTGQWIINSHNGIRAEGIDAIDVPKDYPTIYEYLKQFQKSLELRLDKGKHWTNLRNCSYLSEFDHPKIAWGNLSIRSQFSFVPEGYIINAPSPFFTSSDLFIIGILNSSIGNYYIKQLGVSRNGGYTEFKPMFVEKMPIPNLQKKDQTKIYNLVKEIIALHKEGKTSDNEERQIDELLFDSLNFSSDERALISSI
ncbi:BREX-1 system adenine-specific DNA-methyltransferase PglX [Algoriphagus sp. AGSA1]|uniref:BREX-1 system adenine-specific DNA-methyltransferase PglX n=1 Tax=Algoriphagus sp. AGSA1 TaxID=2907213 RepID=UPI001F30E738|nr:BREX-1 system adenine-specific DNA-methyltransferase PglX [Algoriphagus sp. AGSA1]